MLEHRATKGMKTVPFAASVLVCVAAGLFASRASSQTFCPDQGSARKGERWLAAPTSLACAAAPSWPAWHLFTPAHRAPTAHVGFWPGRPHPLPGLLVRYRCTGLLLQPIVVDQVLQWGYVIDRDERRC